MGVETDLSEQTFGRLTLVSKETGVKDKWECVCSCGKTTIVLRYALLNGNTQSCGCKRAETHTRHGMHKTRFYKIWNNMINRCTYESSVNYKDYGGRGIRFCTEWKDFLNFKRDLYGSYSAHSSKHGEHNTFIERVDVNGNYEASNVKWATRKEQSLNKRVCKGNTSGHTGVAWCKKKNKWRARISSKDKDVHLGYFVELEDAVKVRQEAEKIRNGAK